MSFISFLYHRLKPPPKKSMYHMHPLMNTYMVHLGFPRREVFFLTTNNDLELIFHILVLTTLPGCNYN